MNKANFEPPKLPIAWIASTFVAPALIVILPPIFTAGVSFSTLLIIALALLSVLLLLVCFALIVRIYNEAYKVQIAEYKLDQLEEDLKLLNKRIDGLEQQASKNNSKQDSSQNGNNHEDIR